MTDNPKSDSLGYNTSTREVFIERRKKMVVNVVVLVIFDVFVVSVVVDVNCLFLE